MAGSVTRAGRGRVPGRLPVLAEPAFERMVADAEVLGRDRHRDTVYRRPDGTVVKLFRRRRLLSSSLLWPYAQRFARAVPELERRGVPTIALLGAWRVPSIGRDAVHYRYLEGETLRAALGAADASRRAPLVERWVDFLAELHRLGVHFNDTHLDNFLVLPDRGMGLIDVGVCRFRRGPLPPRLRALDFRRVLRYPADRELLVGTGRQAILDRYLERAALGRAAAERFLAQLRSQCPWFFEELSDGP